MCPNQDIVYQYFNIITINSFVLYSCWWLLFGFISSLPQLASLLLLYLKQPIATEFSSRYQWSCKWEFYQPTLEQHKTKSGHSQANYSFIFLGLVGKGKWSIQISLGLDPTQVMP
uniref:Uncharacterized protein n=1 Tax=Arundo donax TaxID=35708 RepID=A0A0A9HVH5_ARUDO